MKFTKNGKISKFSKFENWSQTLPNMLIRGEIQKNWRLQPAVPPKIKVFVSNITWNKKKKITS